MIGPQSGVIGGLLEVSYSASRQPYKATPWIIMNGRCAGSKPGMNPGSMERVGAKQEIAKPEVLYGQPAYPIRMGAYDGIPGSGAFDPTVAELAE